MGAMNAIYKEDNNSDYGNIHMKKFDILSQCETIRDISGALDVVELYLNHFMLL